MLFCSIFVFLILRVLFDMVTLLVVEVSAALSLGLIQIIFASIWHLLALSLPARIHSLTHTGFRSPLGITVWLKQRSVYRQGGDCPEGRSASQSIFTLCTFPWCGLGRGVSRGLSPHHSTIIPWPSESCITPCDSTPSEGISALPFSYQLGRPTLVIPASQAIIYMAAPRSRTSVVEGWLPDQWQQWSFIHPASKN